MNLLRKILSLLPGKNIRLIRACNEVDGGNHLDVDLTKLYRISPGSLFNLKDTDELHSYKNVCSCVNLPDYIQHLETWSMENYYNDMLAYYERDCTERN